MRKVLVLAVAVNLLACSRETPSPRANAVATALPLERPRIVALGDSLTSGYTLDPAVAWPALLQAKLDTGRYAYELVNAGVSGDTSAGGLQRLAWSLEGDVRVLIVALGANDGLRGLPSGALRENLRTIIERAQARRIKVLLCGLEAPPNLGPAHTAQFRSVFTELAHERRVDAFLPFLLAGVAGDPALNLGDSIHPNAKGQVFVAENVWSRLEPLLVREVGASAGGS